MLQPLFGKLSKYLKEFFKPPKRYTAYVCHRCNEKIYGLEMFKCAVCKKSYCTFHRVPESHGCKKNEPPSRSFREIHRADGKIEASV